MCVPVFEVKISTVSEERVSLERRPNVLSRTKMQLIVTVRLSPSLESVLGTLMPVFLIFLRERMSFQVYTETPVFVV